MNKSARVNIAGLKDGSVMVTKQEVKGLKKLPLDSLFMKERTEEKRSILKGIS